MIGYDHIRGPDGGIYCPVIICDTCGQRITGNGTTYWRVDIDSGDVLPGIWHTHKSTCSHLDEVLGAHRVLVMSEELTRSLDQLTHNTRRPTHQDPR